MLKQVLVVEGKSDIQRVQQALEVECIATEGFNLRKPVLSRIKDAYEKRGIIILTDPDYAGERIRRFLTKRFPLASPESIRKALEVLHIESMESSELFTMQDLVQHDLSGGPSSAAMRARIGAKLGIGYGNGKQFLYRLNHYGISREAFFEALSEEIQ